MLNGLRAIHALAAKSGLTEVQESGANKEIILRDHYYMACSCRRYNACSDWLIFRLLFLRNAQLPITGLQKQSKSHIANNLLASNVRS